MPVIRAEREIAELEPKAANAHLLIDSLEGGLMLRRGRPGLECSALAMTLETAG